MKEGKKSLSELQKGSIIRRLNFSTSATFLNKDYIVHTHYKRKGYDFDYYMVQYRNENGKLSQITSLKNWEIIKK